MTTDPELLAARARVEAAKLRLDGSLADAKIRLEPRTLARETVAGVKARSGAIARDGVEAVRERPAVAVGIAAALGLLVARRPLIARLRRLTGRDATTAANEEFLKPNRASAPTKE